MQSRFAFDRSEACATHPARCGLASVRGFRTILHRQVWALPLAIGLIAALSACSTPEIVPPPRAPAIETYVVGAPDSLQVQILPEPEILREVRVRPDGMISMDLIGDIQAAGRTPAQIAYAIESEISRYKRDAVVNVSVIAAESRFVTIYGEVGQPGIFALETETRLTEAIGRVGGTRPFASLGNVRIIRTSRGEPEILEVHLGDIQKGNLATNFVIEGGDLIVVPPTILAKIGYAMQMLLFPIQPFISGASTAGSIFTFTR